MSEHTRAAALAAMTVPGINRAEFRDGPDGPVGTVRYSPARLFGEPGPEFEVRRDPDGLWNVNGDRDIRDPDLATAIRAAIAATCGETAAGPASRAQPCTRGHETRYRADDGDADTGCQHHGRSTRCFGRWAGCHPYPGQESARQETPSC